MASDGTPDRTRVAIAASHARVRTGLEDLVASHPDVELVALVGDARGAARCVLQHHPDVLIVALAGALRDAGGLIRRLRALSPTTAVVIASTASGEAYRSVAEAAGAASLVALDGPAEDLFDAVRAARHS